MSMTSRFAVVELGEMVCSRVRSVGIMIVLVGFEWLEGTMELKGFGGSLCLLSDMWDVTESKP